MHILDDPCVSARVRTLLAGARRYEATPVDRIREVAHAIDADGIEGPAPLEAVEAMIRFEERYGGLWYSMLGSNGMEHGLDGEATVHSGVLGWTFPGIVDGDWTWRVDVLVDERTSMTLKGKPRVINSSITQRLEAHALLADVRRWPHATFRMATEPGEEPTLGHGALPPQVHEATGPADKWWFDGESAIHLELHCWWQSKDIWVARCFAKRADAVSGSIDSLRLSVAVVDACDQDWCSLCGHFIRSGELCLPDDPV